MGADFRKAINSAAIESFKKLRQDLLDLQEDEKDRQTALAQEYHANVEMIDQYKNIIDKIDTQIHSLENLLSSLDNLSDSKIARMIQAANREEFSNIYHDKPYDLIYLLEDNSLNIIIILLVSILLYKFYSKK